MFRFGAALAIKGRTDRTTTLVFRSQAAPPQVANLVINGPPVLLTCPAVPMSGR